MKKIALAIAAIMFCLALFGCSNTDTNKQVKDVSSSVAKSSTTKSSTKSENISMTFAKLPSPPKCKKTKDQETIHKVIEYIYYYKKVPIENKNEKGWQMLITVSLPNGNIKQYSVIGDKLQIDKSCYKISKDLINNLEKLYNQMDVPEEKY